jgi:GNAT superfamily N-acetyltransferase
VKTTGAPLVPTDSIYATVHQVKGAPAARVTNTQNPQRRKLEPKMHHRQHADFSESRLRAARVDELEILCDIDVDASRLFDQVGLELTPEHSLEFAAAERSRWLTCLQSGTTFLASRQSGEPVGFAAVRMLDGEPYLEQLSVRMNAMRNGIGTALLNAAERLAAETRTRRLWLTTYRHLPWNAPFYERAGFAIVPVTQCGEEMLSELALQRRLLPKPDERVAMRKRVRVAN